MVISHHEPKEKRGKNACSGSRNLHVVSFDTQQTSMRKEHTKASLDVWTRSPWSSWCGSLLEEERMTSFLQVLNTHFSKIPKLEKYVTRKTLKLVALKLINSKCCTNFMYAIFHLSNLSQIKHTFPTVWLDEGKIQRAEYKRYLFQSNISDHKGTNGIFIAVKVTNEVLLNIAASLGSTPGN